MKKGIKAIVCGLCALVCAFGLTACGGESAYELAVKNGFTGTEAEWLSSLHGANGEDGEDVSAQDLYDKAVADGFTGSFLDFCKSLNISLPQYNDTVQIAENMTSAVSIYCGYSKTSVVSTGGGLLGGIGGRETVVEYGTQAGSGVIVDLNKQAGNAYIITNYHVLYNNTCDSSARDSNDILKSIWVYTYGSYNTFNPETNKNGDGMLATFVGGSMDYDIAILKIEGKELLKKDNVSCAKLGDSDAVKVGEETYAIGNPAGAGISVTNGILSVQSERITMAALDGRDENNDKEVDGVVYQVMRTSAAINSGNSGGGLFNTKGELIGIVNAKSSSSTVDNMGYALPINQVKAVCENVIANGGTVKQARFGITVQTTASKSVIGEDGNVSIVEEFTVVEEPTVGYAARGVLEYGDIFLSAQIERNGVKGEILTFTRQYQLTNFLLGVRLGDTVHLTVCDAGNNVVVRSILFDRNDTKYFKPVK